MRLSQDTGNLQICYSFNTDVAAAIRVLKVEIDHPITILTIVCHGMQPVQVIILGNPVRFYSQLD